MIQVEKLSYGFPEKDLYNEISFTIKEKRHYALIGSNGSGKSVLADMLINGEKYLYDGKITISEDCRIGYANQFSIREKQQEVTVFEFLSERFLAIQNEILKACEEMATSENMEQAFEEYQKLLDINEAMDGDNFENKIRKTLHNAGMTSLENVMLSQLSGGEYKLVQIMKEMLLSPNLLVLDEPDVFLDFANMGSLKEMINNYSGTMVVITHNRYLLNHCFDGILHLENCDIQEFDGSYSDYRLAQLKEKLRLKLQYIEEQEEIAATEELVETLRARATKMVNPVIGRSVNAKQSQLDRLIARQIKEPFVEQGEPDINLPNVKKNDYEKEVNLKEYLLKVEGYSVAFDECVLEDVNFEIKAGEKVAIVGANGTGKTTLIRDILENNHPAVHIAADITYESISQLHINDKYDSENKLSGGEENLYHIKQLESSEAELLLLDEPTSHLDIYAQMAFEKALSNYQGAVLMVSHDFYLVAGCADYVLFIEENTIRRMRTRKFRKMVYDKYFGQKYLEIDRKKQELEAAINTAFNEDRFDTVKKLLIQMEALKENGKLTS